MNPFQVLGLEENATPDEVKARWRTLASEHHPDNGGDAERFDECRKAYEQAHALASEPKPCNACGGVGKITEARGFNQVKITCNACGGSGVQK
jgi:DnaJ-class molecular chaperone